MAPRWCCGPDVLLNSDERTTESSKKHGRQGELAPRWCCGPDVLLNSGERGERADLAVDRTFWVNSDQHNDHQEKHGHQRIGFRTAHYVLRTTLTYYALRATCSTLLRPTWYLPRTTCYVRCRATCYVLRATRNVLRTMCYVLRTTCKVRRVTYYVLRATHHVLRTTCYLLHTAL